MAADIAMNPRTAEDAIWGVTGSSRDVDVAAS